MFVVRPVDRSKAGHPPGRLLLTLQGVFRLVQGAAGTNVYSRPWNYAAGPPRRFHLDRISPGLGSPMALVVAIPATGLLMFIGLLVRLHITALRFAKGGMTTSTLLMVIAIVRTKVRNADLMKDLITLEFGGVDGR